MGKKITLDDIFDDDNFGLLDLKPQTSNVKSEDDRLVDSFEEINAFIDKNKREPSTSSMSEYGLLAKLKIFKENESQKKILKPFDRHNLLGHVEMENTTIDDIFNDDDLGLLESDKELDIFQFRHTPNPQDRAETDFVAKRTSIKEKEFEKYEKMFQKVHQELKEGKRKIKEFKDVEKHLKEGRYYLLDGILLYLERANFKRDKNDLSKNMINRKDGRTRIIFENATLSNMLYRSLSKSLYSNGKIVTQSNDSYNQKLFCDTDFVKKEDIQTGWIYVLKSKSENPKISTITDLFKIGFSTTSVDERIKNAKNEATYLFASVKTVAVYKIYNRNADKLENLLHKFFANACLDVDLFDKKGQRITPREWFVVPLKIIEEAISLIINESIVNYEYDAMEKRIKFK